MRVPVFKNGRARAWALSILLAVLIFATSRHYQMGDTYMAENRFDSLSYQAMAAAAPRLPAPTVPYHHAQRFFFPYLLGCVARATGASLPALFRISVLLVCTLTSVAMLAAMDAFKLPTAWKQVLLCMLLFNPYAYRFFFSVPFVITEPIFLLGFSLVVLGIGTRRCAMTATGLALAALARQTGLALLPGLVFYYLLTGIRRDERPVSAAARGGVSIAIPLLIYGVTAAVAMRFGESSRNLEHAVGIWAFLTRQHAGLGFTPFLGRIVLALLPVLAVVPVALWRGRRLTYELWSLLILAGGVLAQPLFAGPVLTGTSGHRLAALSLPACLVFAAGVMEKSRGWPDGFSAYGLMALLFLSSLHHIYAFFGPRPEGQTSFLAVNVFTFISLALVCAIRVRRNPMSSS